jgi:hypothetical protein
MLDGMNTQKGAGRLAVYVSVGCVLLFAGAALGGGTQPAEGEIKVTRNFAAELNASVLAMKEEDRAWPVYRDEMEPLRAEIGELDLATIRVPSDPRWGEARALVKKHAAALEKVRRASELPRLGYLLQDVPDPVVAELAAKRLGEEFDNGAGSENPVLMSVQFSYLSTARVLANMLAVDACVALDEGDKARLADDLLSMVRAAAHMRENAVQLGDLTSCAMLGYCVGVVNETLDSKPDLLTSESLREVGDALREFPAGESGERIRARTDYQRLVLLDALQRVYSDDGNGVGKLMAESIPLLDELAGQADENGGPGRLEKLLAEAPPFATMFWERQATRKETVDEFDRLMRESQWAKPMWEWDKPRGEAEPLKSQQQMWRLKYTVLAIMMPAVERAGQLAEIVTQRRDAACAAVAVELFRRAEKRWPTSWAELVPAYLKEAPKDRFTGKALGFAEREGRPVIYSFGDDRDDDKGEFGKGAGVWTPPGEAKNEGDWVFWPPAVGR